jgi:acetylornithine deacetylase/succinyl-diaminopimelate desuccinylase-like protein
MPSWSSYLDEQQPQFVEQLLDFLRIPSVSAISTHSGDVQRAAEWVAARASAAGMENVQILPTGGHPVVYADWLHAPGKPTVMIYGHFDTQPAFMEDGWSHPPFEPHLENGRVYARGASDDKGNMLVPILAIEALLKTSGALPVNVKFFLEGQEEIGSPQIEPFVAAHKELLTCDLVLSADGGQWSETQPELLVGLRGGCGIQIDVQGATTDLHSGLYGGVIQNPIHALVMLLDSMRSKDGKVLVEGFYDDVVELTPEDRAKIAAVPFDGEEILENLQIPDLFGEPGFSPVERNWARPTLEINGIWGGFQGEGVKTVLPNAAHAKITCRLVANQDPPTIVKLLTQHVEKHAPRGVKVSVKAEGFGAYPYLMPAEHPQNQLVREVLVELYGKEPYYVRSGGSIPVCSLFLRHLGAYTISFGFGIKDEGAHAPDEFYRLSSFAFGQKAYCKLLERLG